MASEVEVSSMSTHILVVDDEKELADVLERMAKRLACFLFGACGAFCAAGFGSHDLLLVKCGDCKQRSAPSSRKGDSAER